MAQGVTVDLDTSRRFQTRLAQLLHAVSDQADHVVFRVAAAVLGDTQGGWPVDTGFSRAYWFGPRRIAPAAYQIGNPAPYSAVIEYGGYRGVGPKTAAFGPATLPGGFAINQGIYPRQQPAAPLRRALARAYGQMTKELGVLTRQQWGRG